MSIERDIDPVHDLLACPAETSWVEFKKNNTDPTMIGIRKPEQQVLISKWLGSQVYDQLGRIKEHLTD